MGFMPPVVEAPVAFPEPGAGGEGDRAADRGPARAYALASIHGVRRATDDAPDQIEVELSVENTGRVPLEWDPGATRLADAARVRLDPPVVRALRSPSGAPDATPPGATQAGADADGEREWDALRRLGPGERAESCLAFPARASSPELEALGLEGLDLSELHLAWDLDFADGRTVTTETRFGRIATRSARWTVRGSLGASCW